MDAFTFCHILIFFNMHFRNQASQFSTLSNRLKIPRRIIRHERDSANLNTFIPTSLTLKKINITLFTTNITPFYQYYNTIFTIFYYFSSYDLLTFYINLPSFLHISFRISTSHCCILLYSIYPDYISSSNLVLYD